MKASARLTPEASSSEGARTDNPDETRSGAAFPEAAPDCGVCGGISAPWCTKAGYRLHRCRSCGTGFLAPDEVPGDLEDIYSQEYFEGTRSTGYPSYLAEAAILEQNFTVRLEWIERWCAPGRILDVGAAYGLFMRAAKARGWKPMGVEIAPDCALEAARLADSPVVAGAFLDAELTGRFDVITMFDVIEHLRDPIASLRRASELLVSGGLLVIETGDAASHWARLLGRRWYFVDPPQHLFYFGASGLEAALKRCGFDCAEPPKRLGRRVSVANICFKLRAAVPRPLEPVVGALGRLPGSFYLNFGDAMTVIGRKP